MRIQKRFATFLLAAGLLSGCAHSYFYLPEISGKGAIYAKGGIIYSIPPEAPVLKMKVVSLGVNDESVLLLRMYFVRTGKASAAETIDPQELTLLFNKTELHPTRVHASGKKKPLIELAPANKQAVELQFQLPKGRSAKNLETFRLHWKIHYGVNQSEEQTTRFDRHDSAPQQGSDDSDFPYDDSPAFQDSSNWILDGWTWF